MKKFHKIVDYLFLYLNVIVIFFLPLNGNTFSVIDSRQEFNVLSPIFILLVVSSFFTSTFNFKNAIGSWYFRALILLFLSYLVSAIVFADQSDIWVSIEHKLSFLTIPVLVFSNSNFYQKNRKVLCAVFLIAVLFSLALLDYKAFLYYEMTDIFSMYVDYTSNVHPTYIGVFVVIALVIALNILFTSKTHWLKSSLAALLAWLFFAHLLLILSKGVIIASAVLILFHILYFVKSERNKVILFLSIVLLPFAFSLFQNNIRELLITTIQTRFSDLTNTELQGGSTSFRYQMIKNSVEIIGDDWLMGVGVGNESKRLVSFYTKNNWEIARANHYNTHNQFFQTWLSLGFFGFLLFALLLFTPLFFKIGVSEKLILFSFIFLFWTEAMLERQHGIIIFTLIYSVIMVNASSQKPAKKSVVK